MVLSRGGRIALWVFAAVVLAFVYVPLAIVTINSFNADRTFGWPPPSFTTAVVGPGAARRRARATRC